MCFCVVARGFRMGTAVTWIGAGPGSPRKGLTVIVAESKNNQAVQGDREIQGKWGHQQAGVAPADVLSAVCSGCKPRSRCSTKREANKNCAQRDGLGVC